VNTYRAVTNNEKGYRPQDDTLASLSEHLGLDAEQLSLLRQGVISVTGERDLDELVEVVREVRPEHRPPILYFARLAPDEASLVYNFVVQLKAAAARAG
jgi:hypothetical protein